jgi:hypothetical protein
VVLGTLGVVNAVVALLGVALNGSTLARWGYASVWLALVVVSAVSWRRQVRRFDEETARLAAPGNTGDEPPAAGPTAP